MGLFKRRRTRFLALLGGALTLFVASCFLREPCDLLALTPPSMAAVVRCRDGSRHFDLLKRSPMGVRLKQALEEDGMEGLGGMLRSAMSSGQDALGFTPREWMVKEVLGRDALIALSPKAGSGVDVVFLCRLGILGRAAERASRLLRRFQPEWREATQVSRDQGWTVVEIAPRGERMLAYARARDVLALSTDRAHLTEIAQRRRSPLRRKETVSSGPPSRRTREQDVLLCGAIQVDSWAPFLPSSLETDLGGLLQPVIERSLGKRLEFELVETWVGADLRIETQQADHPLADEYVPSLSLCDGAGSLLTISWKMSEIQAAVATVMDSKKGSLSSLIQGWDDAFRSAGTAGLGEMLAAVGGECLLNVSDIDWQGKLPLPRAVMAMEVLDEAKAREMFRVFEGEIEKTLYGVSFQDTLHQGVSMRSLPGYPTLCYAFIEGFVLLGIQRESIEDLIDRVSSDQKSPIPFEELAEPSLSCAIVNWPAIASEVDDVIDRTADAARARGISKDLDLLSWALKRWAPSTRCVVRAEGGTLTVWRLRWTQP